MKYLMSFAKKLNAELQTFKNQYFDMWVHILTLTTCVPRSSKVKCIDDSRQTINCKNYDSFNSIGKE